jgi:hypothetical protein
MNARQRRNVLSGVLLIGGWALIFAIYAATGFTNNQVVVWSVIIALPIVFYVAVELPDRLIHDDDDERNGP